MSSSFEEKLLFNLEFYVYQTTNMRKCKIKSHVPFLWKSLKDGYQKNKNEYQERKTCDTRLSVNSQYSYEKKSQDA